MIKKQLKTIIILLVAVVILLLGYLIAKPFVFDEKEEETPLYDEDGDALGNSERPYIYDVIPVENIKSIYVHNDLGEYRFVMDSAAKTLVIEGMELLSINSELLSYLRVNTSSALAMSKLEEVSSDLSEYGLDGGVSDTYYTITASDDTQHTVYIGDLIPTGAGYYCKSEEKPHIYIISTLIDTTILASVNDFIVPTVAPSLAQSDIYNIDSLKIIKNGELLVSFSKASDEVSGATDGTAKSHIMTYPEGYNVSQTVLDTVLERLCAFNGSKVVESNIGEDELSVMIEKYGFKVPSAEVIYTLGSKQYRAVFGNKTEDGSEYYALNINQKTICTIPASDVEFLEYGVLEYIDKFLFQMSIDSIESIEVRTKKHHETFLLSGEKTELAVTEKSSGNKIDTTNFRQFYMDVMLIQLDDYAAAPETPSEILSYKVTTRSGKVYEYHFYDLSTRKVYFTVNGKGQFYANRDSIERVVLNVDKLIKGEKIISQALA